MKILSWNINGIRASKTDLKSLFDSLDADVICLQETKITRDMLDEATAIVDGYNSYFSCSRKRSGYSGVANFCKDSVTPHKAEEGLSGVLTAGDTGSVGHYGNHSTFTDDELNSLDAEGRTVITQHKIKLPDGTEKDLVIINVYCPRFDPGREDRHLFKLRFFALLQTRAEALLKTGSHVIILGDINTTHKAIDHCDPQDEESEKRPSRKWLNQLLWEQDRDVDIDDVIDREEFIAVTPYTTGGKFVDTYRFFHPDKEGAFSNWCTLTNARATNYGRRLDYILGDVDLVRAIVVDASIMQDVEGSDHCPVTIELNCTPVPSKTCPQFCTKFMPEFSGKQQKLSMFFTKMVKKDISQSSYSNEEKSNKTNNVSEENVLTVNGKTSSSVKRPVEKTKSSPQASKRQKTNMKKTTSGGVQSSLASFFSKGNTNDTKKPSVKETNVNNEEKSKYFKTDKDNTNDKEIKICESSTNNDISKVDGDIDKNTNPKVVRENSNTTSSAWKNLLGGLGPVPLCKGHSEPCVLRMVKKPGPNKGKQFYTCARGEGLKSNPEARCDFFKWIEKKKK